MCICGIKHIIMVIMTMRSVIITLTYSGINYVRTSYMTVTCILYTYMESARKPQDPTRT